MTNATLYFEQSVLTNGIDTSEFEDVMTSLKERDYQRVNLKPLKGRKGFFRAKTNYQGRIILTNLERGGKNYLVVVEHLKDHKYDRSKSLNATKELNPQDFDKQIKDSDSDDCEDELSKEDIELFQTIFQDISTTSFTQKKAFCVNKTYISLSDCQSKVKQLPAPVIVNGLPGTGKTILLIEVTLDFVQQNTRSTSTNSTSTPEKVFYVAASPPFIASVQKEWIESPSVPAGEDRVHFLSYRDFAIRQDPSLALKKEVGLREFIIWTKKKEIGELNPRTIYKDLRFVSICKTIEDYKKIGVRNLHYHKPEQMEIIWGLYQDYKKSLGNTHVDWAFTEFEITQFCDLLCVDEGQDLSLIQIILLILSAKKKQFYLAMDVNQSLFLDISIRPLLMQLLAKYNFEISPENVYLRANHRMPQAIADIATIILKIKHHLMGGLVDSQESFALEDIQGNDKPGEVTLLLKPNPKEKKSEISLTDPQTLEIHSQYLRDIAHQTNTAFIVPNEIVRQQVMELYGATQVFLPDEAKGLQWEIVVAIDMHGSSDAIELLQQADQQLPHTAADLRKNPNRPKNKEDNSQSELNSAFAAPLVAISRCTKTLYIVETYSRKNVRFLSLLQQAISPAVEKPREKQVVTQAMWVEQIKKLITNGNMPQAILAARQELKLTVDEAITDAELLLLIEKTKELAEPSIGLEVNEKKFFKHKNSKKTQPQSATSSGHEIAKPEVFTRAQLEKHFVAIIEKFSNPKSIEKLEKAFGQEPYISHKVPLDFLMIPKVQANLMTVEQSAMIIGYFFKKENNYQDSEGLSAFFVEANGKHYTKFFKWMMQNAYGIQVFTSVFSSNQALKEILVLPLCYTVSQQRRVMQLGFSKEDELLWSIASSMGEKSKGVAKQFLNAKVDKTIERQRHYLSLPIESKEQFFQLLEIIINLDIFTQIFFMSNNDRKNHYTISFFFKIASNEKLMTLFIAFLMEHPKEKEIFEKTFGPECLQMRCLANGIWDIPLHRHQFCEGFQYQQLSLIAKKFIIGYLSRPDFVLADDCGKLDNFRDIRQQLEPMMDCLFWLTFNLIKNPFSNFLSQLSGQDQVMITGYFAIHYKNTNLKAELRELLGESYLPDWEMMPDHPDIVDILLMSSAGIDFMYWVVKCGHIENMVTRIIGKLEQSITSHKGNPKSSLFYRVCTRENGQLLLSLVKVQATQFNNMYELIRKQIEAKKYDAEVENLYRDWLISVTIYKTDSELLREFSKDAKLDPFFERDSRIGSLETFMQNITQVKIYPVSPENAPLMPFDKIYNLFYYSHPVSTLMKVSGNTGDMYELIRLFSTSLRRFSGLNLPMSTLFGKPLQNSVYSRLALTPLGRLIIEILLRIRAFDLSTITAEQLIHTVDYCHLNNEPPEISLFYVLSVTAGVRGHQHLLKLTNETPMIYSVLRKTDFQMKSRSQIFTSSNSNQAEFDFPVLRLTNSTEGTKLFNNYNQHKRAPENIFSADELQAIKDLSKAAEISLLSPNLTINTLSITPSILQMYVQGAAYKDEHLIRGLCDPFAIKHFSELLDDEKLSASPITLAMIIDQNAIGAIHAAGSIGLSVLMKLFRNGKFLLSSPDLERFFDYVEQGIDNLTWFLQTSDRIKFLYEALEVSPQLVKICLKRLDKVSTSSLRNSNASLDPMHSDYVIVALENVLNRPSKLARQMIIQKQIQILKLQEVFSKRFDILSKKIISAPGNDVSHYAEYIQFLRPVFASRDFAKLFFMSLVTTLDNGKQCSPGSLFLRILADKKLTEWLITFISTFKANQDVFMNNFNLGCLMKKGYSNDNNDSLDGYKTSLIGEPVKICHTGKLFLLNNLAHPTSHYLEQVHDLDNLIKINQNTSVLVDPFVWLTMDLISNPKNEFMHTMHGVRFERVALYLKKDFNQKSLKAAIFDSLEHKIATDLFGDGSIDFLDQVFDMIDLLTYSGVGVLFLIDYLDYGDDKAFAIKLIEKLVADLQRVMINERPRILFNLLSKESGSMIIRRLSSQHPEFKSFHQGLTQLKSLNKNQDLLSCIKLQLGKEIPEISPSHLWGGKAANYHFIYVDSRVSSATQLISRYGNLSDHLAKTQFGTELNDNLKLFIPDNGDKLRTHFTLLFRLFYKDKKDTIKEYLPPSELGIRFALFAFKNPFFFAFKNIPMLKLIDEPVESSLYYLLLPTVLGRQLIGFFFHLRTFSLGTITQAQLLISIAHAQQYANEGALLSLFYILAVTAEEIGHAHLLTLMEDSVVAKVLQKSDLHMEDKSKIFDGESCTPYKSLQKTATGKKVLACITVHNDKFAYTETGSAGMWQAETSSDTKIQQSSNSGYNI